MEKTYTHDCFVVIADDLKPNNIIVIVTRFSILIVLTVLIYVLQCILASNCSFPSGDLFNTLSAMAGGMWINPQL